MSSAGPGSHPQLLDHRPHRSRQVDARRPDPRADPHRRRPLDAGPGARLDGARARARDHDQGPGRARVLQGLPTAPDRHARACGLHLRGVTLAGGLRGGAAGRGRLAGGRGADRRQHLPGDRLGARADPLPEQGRPPGRRARARRRGGGGPAGRAGTVGEADQREDGRGHRGGARGADRARAAAERRPGRPAPGTDLRLGVRPVPRRHRLHPRGRRHVLQGWGDPRDAGRNRGGDRRHRVLHAADEDGGRAPRRRGRVPDHGDQGRDEAPRGRHADNQGERGHRAAAGLPRGQADGVLRAVPARLRRLPGPARRAREALAQRRRPLLGAGDLRCARVRLPLRLSGALAHGHRARAAGARVRPGAAADDAERGVRGHADRRDDGRGPLARPTCRTPRG